MGECRGIIHGHLSTSRQIKCAKAFRKAAKRIQESLHEIKQELDYENIEEHRANIMIWDATWKSVIGRCASKLKKNEAEIAEYEHTKMIRKNEARIERKE